LKVKIILVGLIALILCSFDIKDSKEITTTISGTYRLRYEEIPSRKSSFCWSFMYEELLQLNPDSSYVLTRVLPVGGPVVLPDSGKWAFRNAYLILNSSTIDWYHKKFKIVENGIIEPSCSVKKFRKIVWAKE
jgi:hypothetical protein